MGCGKSKRNPGPILYFDGDGITTEYFLHKGQLVRKVDGQEAAAVVELDIKSIPQDSKLELQRLAEKAGVKVINPVALAKEEEEIVPQDVYTLPVATWQEQMLELVRTDKAFRYVDERKIDELISSFEGPSILAPGTEVMRQGTKVASTEPCLFILESGSLEVYVVKGKQEFPGNRVLTMTKPWQMIGRMASMFDCARTATVIAVSESKVWHISRAAYQSFMDEEKYLQAVSTVTNKLTNSGFMPRIIAPTFGVFDLNLNLEPDNKDNIRRYYEFCKASIGFLVTLSCFAIWNKHKKINGYAKVIPAVPASHSDNVRVFFFDDNIEWDGQESSSGICNLRHAFTSEFVDFSEGANGFIQERANTYTTVHHSDQFKAVLVQANILDSMADPEYFTKIVKAYSKPGEKLLIYMDVNATVISLDSISGKELSHVVLGTLLEYTYIEPHEKFDFFWEDRSPVKIEKKMSLKALAKKVSNDDKGYYDAFYTYENSLAMLDALEGKGELTWLRHDIPFSKENFNKAFTDFTVGLDGGTDDEGIANSWFRLLNYLKEFDHCITISSFGVDTRKLLIKSADDERQIPQFAVNFDYWDSRDVKAFEKMYQVSLRRRQSASL